MVKVLITGANGFVGKNLVEFYQQKQYQIISINRQDNIEDGLLQNPEFIINCAASIYDYQSMFNTNVLLVNHIIEHMKYNKCKFLQIGSSAEYGKKSHPTSESDVLEPVSFYAGTKAAATMMCVSAAREFGLPIVVARPYSLYGIYEKEYRLFTRLYQALKNNTPMVLCEGYHDFIYIKDFIRGLDNLLFSNYDMHGDVVNFGSGVQTSNYEVLELFLRIMNIKEHQIQIENRMAKSFESKTWVCNTDYAKSRYDFITQYTLYDGITDLITIYQDRNII